MADYTTNFSPVRADFSSASRTNLLKKIFVITWREFQPWLKAWAEISSPVKRADKHNLIAFKFQPRLKCELGHAHSAWVVNVKTLSCKLFLPKFKYCARDEIRHVIARTFQNGGRTEISAQAEIRHVIGPFSTFCSQDCLKMGFSSRQRDLLWLYHFCRRKSRGLKRKNLSSSGKKHEQWGLLMNTASPLLSIYWWYLSLISFN